MRYKEPKIGDTRKKGDLLLPTPKFTALDIYLKDGKSALRIWNNKLLKVCDWSHFEGLAIITKHNAKRIYRKTDER